MNPLPVVVQQSASRYERLFVEAGLIADCRSLVKIFFAVLPGGYMFSFKKLPVEIGKVVKTASIAYHGYGHVGIG